MRFNFDFLRQHIPGHLVSRFDESQNTAFLTQQLQQVIAQNYDRLFPDLDGRTFLPISSDVAPGAMSWAYDSYDQRGRAKFMSAAMDDIPMAEVSVERTSLPIQSITMGYGWTVEELLAAQFAGVPLNAKRANGARRAIAEFEDDILLLGAPEEGLPGFLTNPAVPRLTVPNGNWLDSGTSADEMLEDLNVIADHPWITTNRIFRTDVIALPLAMFRAVNRKRIDNTSVTVRQFFLDNYGFPLTIRPMFKLETAGLNGGPMALAYQNSSDNVAGIIPMPLKQEEPQYAGLRYMIHMWSRQGGTVFFRPFSAVYADGI